MMLLVVLNNRQKEELSCSHRIGRTDQSASPPNTGKAANFTASTADEHCSCNALKLCRPINVGAFVQAASLLAEPVCLLVCQHACMFVRLVS